MHVSSLRAFERLLEGGASESDVDRFLGELTPHADKSSYTHQLRLNFSRKGLFRDQVEWLSNLYASGIAIDRHSGSRVAFIFFQGLLDSIGVCAARARLRQMNVNCIYLHDDTGMNYLLGVRQCGADFPETIAALLQHIRGFGVDRITTVGSSAGGFAAIKYALALDAYASVTFSPFTTFADDHQRHDGRGKAIIARYKLVAPDELIDLVPLLTRREPALKLVCFYPQDSSLDVWHVQRVKGLRDVFPIAVNLNSHNILGPLIACGIFETLMRPLAEGSGVKNGVSRVLTGFAQAHRSAGERAAQ